METSSFLSSQELKNLLMDASLEEWEKILPNLSDQQLNECLALFQSEFVSGKQNKLNALFLKTDSRQQWENFGRIFNASTFFDYLDFLQSYSDHQQNFSYVLSALEPKIFSQSLHLLEENHLQILKNEALLEPLHYLIQQFIHEGEEIRDEVWEKGEQFQKFLPSIEIENLTPQDLNHLYNEVDQLADQLFIYDERARKALSLVWNTERLDLIENLSQIHEQIQHQAQHLIGKPAYEGRPSTGLYATMNETFSKIYLTSLKDEDSAIEGLTRLSVWHLQDYWEIGLLPHIKNGEEVNLDPEKHTEKECWEHREKQIAQIQRHLERLDLKTVASLRRHQIFSKSLLKNFIASHQQYSIAL